MSLDEALAVYLYMKDNVESWVEPGKSAKAEAWQVICKSAQETVERRGHNR